MTYFVEAKLAVKDHGKVIAYQVWHSAHGAGHYDEGCPVREFVCARKGGEEAALSLANAARDALTKGGATKPSRSR